MCCVYLSFRPGTKAFGFNLSQDPVFGFKLEPALYHQTSLQQGGIKKQSWEAVQALPSSKDLNLPQSANRNLNPTVLGTAFVAIIAGDWICLSIPINHQPIRCNTILTRQVGGHIVSPLA